MEEGTKLFPGLSPELRPCIRNNGGGAARPTSTGQSCPIGRVKCNAQGRAKPLSVDMTGNDGLGRKKDAKSGRKKKMAGRGIQNIQLFKVQIPPLPDQTNCRERAKRQG